MTEKQNVTDDRITRASAMDPIRPRPSIAPASIPNLPSVIAHPPRVNTVMVNSVMNPLLMNGRYGPQRGQNFNVSDSRYSPTLIVNNIAIGINPDGTFNISITPQVAAATKSAGNAFA